MQQKFGIGVALHGAGEWCLDSETRDNIVARRNVLIGMWAGRLLGKSGEALAAYARETHISDFEVPGDSDIVSKLSSDLANAGYELDGQAIRQQLGIFRRQAYLESVATD